MSYRNSTQRANEYESFLFVKNLQGDIIKVLDNEGNLLVSYTYDAWGNPTSTTYSNGGASTAAIYNPFRYRGYYYDSETGFYYLNSRYYNPVIGRFISPDSSDILNATPMALTDKNLYAYCDNNPITREDGDGDFWNLVIGASVGAIVGGVLGAITASRNGQDVLTGALTGAALGTIAGVIVGSGNVAVISSGLSSMASKAATDIIGSTMYGSKVGSWEDYAIAFVFGGVTSGIGANIKMVADIAVRPAINQFVKIGTRGGTFDGNKYAYDVVSRAATAGGSKNVLSGSINGLNIKVDIGKAFYRASTRAIYSYFQ